MSGRIRSIKPEWLEDEKLLRAGSHARVLSVALLLLADDYGRGRFIEEKMGPEVFTFEPNPLEIFREAFARLSDMGFSRVYTVRGQRYFAILNWSKHQKVDHPGKPRVPEPLGEFERYSRESRESLDSDHDHDHDQEQEGEGSVRGCESSSQEPDGSPLELFPDEPLPKTKPAKPRDEATLLWTATLKAEAKALGIPTPDIGRKVRDAVLRMVREHAENTGQSFASVLRAWVAGGLKVHVEAGKAPQWALKDWRPYQPRAAPSGGRPGRLAPAPPAPASAFENDEDIEETMARWEREGRNG